MSNSAVRRLNLRSDAMHAVIEQALVGNAQADPAGILCKSSITCCVRVRSYPVNLVRRIITKTGESVCINRS